MNRFFWLPLAAVISLTGCNDESTTPFNPTPGPLPGTPLFNHIETGGPDVEPTFSSVTRNQTCQQLMGDGIWEEIKIDESLLSSSDPYRAELGAWWVEVHHFNGKSYDFVSNRTVHSVYNKAGAAGSYLYDYLRGPDGDESTTADQTGGERADDGLTTPEESGNNISHVSFCRELKPDYTLQKTGDELSKVGDPVTYTFALENTGDFVLTLSSFNDDVLGDLTASVSEACRTLDVGETCSFTYGPWLVPEGSADPLVNTATAVYNAEVAGSTVSETRTDTHSLNLFQPSVTLDKTGPSYSKVGDVATYTYTITNGSSGDAPNLVFDSATDDKIGDLSGSMPSSCASLASGSSCSFTADYKVLASDDSGLEGATLTNTAEVHYHPDGFPNDITDSDTHTLTLVHPQFEVAKVCLAEPLAHDAGLANFRITLSNTGDVGLLFDLSDPAASFSETDILVGKGESVTRDVSVPFASGATAVSNTVYATSITLPASYGLSNEYTDEATDVCTVEPPPAGGEGCTPGYWKNHLDSWEGYSSSQTVEEVFDVPDEYNLDSYTLLQALDFDGGDDLAGMARNLLRIGTAAVLNAAHSEVSYDGTTFDSPEEVIAAVNTALASRDRSTMENLKNVLDNYNNSFCPLN